MADSTTSSTFGSRPVAIHSTAATRAPSPYCHEVSASSRTPRRREAALASRVVRRDHAEALVARAPRHRDHVSRLESLQHGPPVTCLVNPRGAKHQVVKDNATRGVIAVGRAGRRGDLGEELGVDPVGPWNGLERALLAQLPEQHLAGFHELRDARGQAVIEVRKPVPRPRVTRDREQHIDRSFMSALDTIGAPGSFVIDQPLPLAALEVGAQVEERVHLLPAFEELGESDRRRHLVGEDRERTPLRSRITDRARDAQGAELAAARHQGLCAGGADLRIEPIAIDRPAGQDLRRRVGCDRRLWISGQGENPFCFAGVPDNGEERNRGAGEVQSDTERRFRKPGDRVDAGQLGGCCLNRFQ